MQLYYRHLDCADKLIAAASAKKISFQIGDANMRFLTAFFCLMVFQITQAHPDTRTQAPLIPAKSKIASAENETQFPHLPFSLSKDDIHKVEIKLLFQSQKLNAGNQEIIISGNGILHLKRNLNVDEKPETKSAKISKVRIVVLLELMEEENFMGLQDACPDETDPHGYRIISLRLPKQTKSVMVYDPTSPEFERTAGAIKVVAGMTLPVALMQRFFPNL